MTDFTPLEARLRQLLSPSQRAGIARLLALLTEMESGDLSRNDVEQQIRNDPELPSLSRALAGQQLSAGMTTVSFGAGSQLGDVSIENAAARDVIRISFHLHAAEPESAELARRNKYITSGEIFSRARAYAEAIEQYSQAIAILPSTTLFITRARLYRLVEDRVRALDDLEAAINSADTIEEEKQARLERFRWKNYSKWHSDFAWLKLQLSERELGRLLYEYLEHLQSHRRLYMEETAAETVAIADDAIRYEGSHPNIYLIRAEIHCGNCNYGLALQDVNRFLQLTEERDRPAFALGLKGFLLAKMGKFEELYELLTAIQERYPYGTLAQEFPLTFAGFEEEILCRYAVEYRFRRGYQWNDAKSIIAYFAHWHPAVQQKYPRVSSIIHQLMNAPPVSVDL